MDTGGCGAFAATIVLQTISDNGNWVAAVDTMSLWCVLKGVERSVTHRSLPAAMWLASELNSLAI